MKIVNELSFDDSKTICRILSLNNQSIINFSSALKTNHSEKEFYFEGQKYKIYDKESCTLVLFYFSQSKGADNSVLFKRLSENSDPRNYIDTVCVDYDEEELPQIDKVKNKNSQKKL